MGAKSLAQHLRPALGRLVDVEREVPRPYVGVGKECRHVEALPHDGCRLLYVDRAPLHCHLHVY